GKLLSGRNLGTLGRLLLAAGRRRRRLVHSRKERLGQPAGDVHHARGFGDVAEDWLQDLQFAEAVLVRLLVQDAKYGVDPKLVEAILVFKLAAEIHGLGDVLEEGSNLLDLRILGPVVGGLVLCAGVLEDKRL